MNVSSFRPRPFELLSSSSSSFHHHAMKITNIIVIINSQTETVRSKSRSDIFKSKIFSWSNISKKKCLLCDDMQVMTVLSLTLLHIVPLVSLTYLNYAIFCAIRSLNGIIIIITRPRPPFGRLGLVKVYFFIPFFFRFCCCWKYRFFNIYIFLYLSLCFLGKNYIFLSQYSNFGQLGRGKAK